MKKKTLIRKLLEDCPDLTQEQIADIVGCHQGTVSKAKNESLDEHKLWGMTEEDIKLLEKLQHPEKWKHLYNGSTLLKLMNDQKRNKIYYKL
jgi:hypothetical protein